MDLNAENAQGADKTAAKIRVTNESDFPVRLVVLRIPLGETPYKPYESDPFRAIFDSVNTGDAQSGDKAPMSQAEFEARGLDAMAAADVEVRESFKGVDCDCLACKPKGEAFNASGDSEAPLGDTKAVFDPNDDSVAFLTSYADANDETAASLRARGDTAGALQMEEIAVKLEDAADELAELREALEKPPANLDEIRGKLEKNVMDGTVDTLGWLRQSADVSLGEAQKVPDGPIKDMLVKAAMRFDAVADELSSLREYRKVNEKVSTVVPMSQEEVNGPNAVSDAAPPPGRPGSPWRGVMSMPTGGWFRCLMDDDTEKNLTLMLSHKGQPLFLDNDYNRAKSPRYWLAGDANYDGEVYADLLMKTQAQKDAMSAFERLSPAAQDVMGQLFLLGPMWTGNVASKSGRDELVIRGLAATYQGTSWTYLTAAGVMVAVEADVRAWRDQRWYRKQRDL